MSEDIFDSSLRSMGDLAGVFEYDGETGYFYLYEPNAAEGNKILDTIRVIVGPVDFSEANIDIAWSSDEGLVGLYIRGRLWAVFDTETKQKYGDTYHVGGHAGIPRDVEGRFLA